MTPKFNLSHSYIDGVLNLFISTVLWSRREKYTSKRKNSLVRLCKGFFFLFFFFKSDTEDVTQNNRKIQSTEHSICKYHFTSHEKIFMENIDVFALLTNIPSIVQIKKNISWSDWNFAQFSVIYLIRIKKFPGITRNSQEVHILCDFLCGFLYLYSYYSL